MWQDAQNPRVAKEDFSNLNFNSHLLGLFPELPKAVKQVSFPSSHGIGDSSTEGQSATTEMKKKPPWHLWGALQFRKHSCQGAEVWVGLGDGEGLAQSGKRPTLGFGSAHEMGSHGGSGVSGESA